MKHKEYLRYLYRLGYGNYGKFPYKGISMDLKMDIYAAQWESKPAHVIQGFVKRWEKFFLSRIKELDPLSYDEWMREIKIIEILEE